MSLLPSSSDVLLLSVSAPGVAEQTLDNEISVGLRYPMYAITHTLTLVIKILNKYHTLTLVIKILNK